MTVKIIKKELKYPPIQEGNKVSYLLLHLAVPLDTLPPSTRHLKIAKKAANSLGIKLSTILVEDEINKGSGIQRYLFRYPYYRKSDKAASQFANTVLLAASITFGPFLDDRDDLSSFRIPQELIRNRNKVYLGELIQVEETRKWDKRITEFPATLIGSSTRFSHIEVERAWMLTPLLFENQQLRHAFRFLKTSQENFFVWPGQIDDIAEEPHQTAENLFQQSRLENALQDSFKAVEAVLGDPPKSDERLFRKIESIGVDPKMEFGFEDKLIYQVIRDMNFARDKKAAHGSTSDRAITVGELLVFQKCARFLVLKASEYIMGDKL